MSAHPWTDSRIQCDAPACPVFEWASHLDLADATAANARKVLRRRGWAVAVKERGMFGDNTSGRRLDFCPAHKPGGTR